MLTSASRQRDFPSLTGKTYLNTAAEGIPPLTVRDALTQYWQDKQLGMDGRVPHFAQLEGAKALVAELYGLTPAEIAICSCSSEAYNLAALALRLQDGDEVVINDLDFPAGATPWLQADCPATVKIWRARGGVLRVEDLADLLGPRTRFVTTSLVSFFNGYMIPLRQFVETVRRHSPALLSVDVTQALGRIPLDLSGVDLIVSSTHKWILASHGGGLVGIPKSRADQWTVPAGGWYHLRDAFGPGRFDKAESQPGAAGFAVGMPNFPAIYCIRAALDYIRGVGVENIHRAAAPLVRDCLERVARLPVELLSPRDPESLAGIVAFRHPAAEALYNALHARNIHVMHHAGRLRIALHGYNTPEDVETLIRALEQALKHV
ncbi:MAG: aminotransferase class V-fold PLP-dependent enzyme [Planctomycetales bacterium]